MTTREPLQTPFIFCFTAHDNSTWTKSEPPGILEILIIFQEWFETEYPKICQTVFLTPWRRCKLKGTVYNKRLWHFYMGVPPVLGLHWKLGRTRALTAHEFTLHLTQMGEHHDAQYDVTKIWATHGGNVLKQCGACSATDYGPSHKKPADNCSSINAETVPWRLMYWEKNKFMNPSNARSSSFVIT